VKFFIRTMALVGLASITLAWDANISWTPPTFYVDGTPLLEQDLDFYTLYCDGTAIQQIDSIIGTPTALATFPDTIGTHTCHLTVTTLNGMESEASNTYVFTRTSPVPNPPVVVWPL
jgi:hypothetical protein